MLIVDLHSSMIRLIKKMMSFFIPMADIKETPLPDIPFMDRDHQCDDLQLNCGTLARTMLVELEETVPSAQIQTFLQ